MRKRLTIGAATTMTFALGLMLAVFVAGSAVAASTTKASKTTAAKSTTTDTTSTDSTTTTASPADGFLVLNGTANAASDHEIVGSSAFPNFANGAVDNYYSLAHAHVDNSPFAQGTASPFDTGPLGQTAAAGNTQQPQYADARWPGSSGKASYGNQGGPYAEATADDFTATANASEATNKLSGPSAPANTVVVPKVLDGRLRAAIAGWKSTWQGRLGQKKTGGKVLPSRPSLPKPTLPVPKPSVPKPSVPKPTVTTPVATVTAPSLGGNVPKPVQTAPPSVPAPTVPSPTASSAPSRSLAASSTPTDGESLLSSSTEVRLVETGKKATKAPTTTTTTATTMTSTTKKGAKPKPAKAAQPTKSYALVTSGESSLGRVSLGGGQIVIEGIHVTASITNDGTPSYKANVSVASATIGGIPVTIDQDGVHVQGQGQALPYQQASDALNNALKQAGVQLFLVGPEVTTGGSCDQSSAGGGTDTGATSTTTSTDQSGSSDGCGQSSSCDQAGSSDSGGGAPGLGTSTTSTTDTTATDGCGGTTTCDQMSSTGSTDTGTGTTTTSPSPTAPRPGTTTTKTTTDATDTTSSSCGSSGSFPSVGTCSAAGAGSGTSTSANSQTDTTDSSSSSMSDPFGFGASASTAGEETVTATGVHVVFTQPVDQAGVPAQHIEHILGEVYVDSLATPGTPGDGLSGFGFSSGSSSSSSSCLGGGSRSGTSAAGSGLSAGGGASAAGSLSGGQSGTGFASGAQPLAGSSGSGTSLPVAFATALRKPLWLLLAYLVWQTLVIGTGISLWHWRRGDPS